MSNSNDILSMNGYSVEKVLSDTCNLVCDRTGELKVVKSFKCPVKHIREIVSQLQELCQSIKHDDLVDIKGMFCADDTIYIIFTYCEGGSLAALVKRAKHYDEILNEFEITDWFIQIASCLQHLHSRGLVYSLLNPKNVLLHNNSCKLSSSKLISRIYPSILSRSCVDGDASRVETDNILSCSVIDRDLLPQINSKSDQAHNDVSNDSSQSDCNVNQITVSLRNLSPYLSPQLVSTRDVELQPTPADDMWSLGCLLCEMCTRQKTFPKNCVGMEDFNLPRFPEQFSTELTDISRRLLDKDHLARSSASDLLCIEFLVRYREEMQSLTMQTMQKVAQFQLDENVSQDRYLDVGKATSCNNRLENVDETEREDLSLTSDDINELLASL